MYRSHTSSSHHETYGSLWTAATGGLAKSVPPQNSPPAGESDAQYLNLFSVYVDTMRGQAACNPKRENLGLILGAAVVVGMSAEVLRRCRMAADATVDIEPMRTANQA